MYYQNQRTAKLIDSQQHGPQAELLLVEGDSAARSAASMRNPQFQGVLPLQGKPLNALKAQASKIAESPLFAQLAQALGLASPCAMTDSECAQLRYARLVLLFDPDADGIHIGALVLLYLHRCLPALLAQQRVVMVRPPMFALQLADTDSGEITTRYAYSPQHHTALKAQCALENLTVLESHGYRGLGSIPPEVLRASCIDPATRHAHAVTAADMQAVLQVFG